MSEIRARAHAEVMKLSGRLGKETDKAISIKLDADNVDLDVDNIPSGYIWFQLSQVTEIHRTYSLTNGTPDELVVSLWVLRQKGMM